MKTSEAVLSGNIGARFQQAVEAWCSRKGVSAGALGASTLRDRDFVPSLRRGRNPRLRTLDSVLAAMGEPPAGPAFLGEVEVFLAVTGIKRSLLGREATGNPSFVAHLRKGVSPTLATVRDVRVWMASHASVDEWREIRSRTGAMPLFLTDVPLPAPERRCPPEDRDPGSERLDGRDDVGRYMDTREAAQRLGLAPATLARYRITGEGPIHFRFGGCVRYHGDDLEAWATGRRTRRRPRTAVCTATRTASS